ncbi:MAG TPA: glycine zipper domain-containing protein [Sphingobium sp.]
MKKTIMAVTIGSLMVAGCANNYEQRRAATRGALIGAVGGAAVSALAGGDALEGAAMGAAAGAAIGYITKDGKRREVYRGRDGGRYWVDDRGRQRRY